MTDIVTLDAARAHLRVGREISDDDLMELVDTAQQLVEDYLTYPIIGERWPTAEVVPLGIVVAIKVVALDLYDNRNTPLADLAAVRALAGRYRRESF